MARLLSKTLTLNRSSPLLLPLITQFRRHFSIKAELVELDLDSESEDSTLKRLEDVVNNIIVRRSAPDWIQFKPGTSYWVPPRPKTTRFVEIVGSEAALSEEEALCLDSVNGAPCSSYFIDGTMPHSPSASEPELEVEFHVQPPLEELPEDETGMLI